MDGKNIGIFLWILISEELAYDNLMETRADLAQQSFRLTYSCTRAEMSEAQSISIRKQLGRGSKWLTLIILFAILGLVMLMFYFGLLRDVSPTYRPYVIASVPALMAFFYFQNRRNQSKRAKVLATIEISDHDITLLARDRKTSLPWSAFSECFESPALFVLVDRPKGSLFVIPKRAFPDEDAQIRFRSLANQRQAPQQAAPIQMSSDVTITEDQVLLKFQLGFKDYLDRTLASWRTWSAIFGIFAFIIGLSVYAAQNPPPHAVNSATKVFFLFELPMMFLLLVFAVMVMTLSTWRSHKRYLIPQQIVLSEHSIQLSSTDGDNLLPWTTFSHYKVTSRSIIIWKGPNWLLIPKRAFDSAANQQLCQVLFGKHFQRSRWFFG